MNFSLWIGLKQHRRIVGGVLLMSVITGCNDALPPQSPDANISPMRNPPIASSPPPSAALTQAASAPQQKAVQVIRNYYSAIDRQDYEQAYSAWDGEGTASQQSLEQFKQGFASTASTAVEVGKPGRVEGAAGSSYIQIPVTVTATTTNGTPQRFRGSYVLRRVNEVPSSTPEQRRWHLYSARITQAH